MNILLGETEVLVKKEKTLTIQILKNLQQIGAKRLHCELGYGSLFLYMIKHLGYSEKETALRISSLKLLTKAPALEESVSEGKLTLTQLSTIQRHTDKKDSQVVEDLARKVEGLTTRKTEILLEEFVPRKEKKQLCMKWILLSEKTYKMLEKIKEDNISDDDLIRSLVEQKLVENRLSAQKVTPSEKEGRYIPQRLKDLVMKRENFKCENCGHLGTLQYEHIHPIGKGGISSCENLKILCQKCNQWREILEYGQEKMSSYLNS